MNTDSTTAPLEPHLIPDSPADSGEPKPGPQSPAIFGAKRPRKKPADPPPSGPKEQMFTLEDAYEFRQSGGHDTSGLEKVLRASAFLLEWSSNLGNNDDVDRNLVDGIACVLRRCAREVQRLFTYDDIERLGADPREVRAARSERES
jgi:hypothetical protein